MSKTEIEEADIISSKARFWIWLIPLAAILAGSYLLWQHYAQRGVLINVSFKTASGLVEGKSELRFKDLAIGTLEKIVLSPDLNHINAIIRVKKDMHTHLGKESRFWVVRPRIDKQGISGFNTLLSGAYIAVEPKAGKGENCFTGLEDPPLTPSETPGIRLSLRTDSGNLNVGTPVYYKKMQVGTVEALSIDKDHQNILLDIFVRSPYDQHITRASRFWQETGIDFSLGADGVRIHTESLETLLTGGIAFDNPDPQAPPVKDFSEFPLFPDFNEIQSRSMQMGEQFIIYFKNSLRGLLPGAPVDFQGVQVGEVLEVNLYYDEEKDELSIPVKIAVLTRKLAKADAENPEAHFIKMLHQGLKARLQMGNMLTGRLFISLEMDKEKPVKDLEKNSDGRLIIPVLPHPVSELTDNVLKVFSKIEKLPIEEIAKSTLESLESTRRFMNRIEDMPLNLKPLFEESQKVLQGIDKSLGELDKNLKSLQEGSHLYNELNRAIAELAESARAIRILAESIEARPDTLIYGK